MEIKITGIERIHGQDKFSNPTTTLEVSYESGGVPAKQRIVPFANPSVFKTLDGASIDESFDVAVTKNAKGYDVWSSIGAVGTIRATPATKVIGSNYETVEERAIKQRYIVRQSSLANAIAFHQEHEKTSYEIIQCAKEFEEYVFSPLETL
jgi:hypothetical protein